MLRIDPGNNSVRRTERDYLQRPWHKIALKKIPPFSLHRSNVSTRICPRGSTPPLREGQILVGRLVVVLLVVGCVSQNIARLALSDAYRGRQLFLLDRHRLRILVLPFVHGTAPGVHEEIADRRRLQAQLPRDCHLHLLRRPLGLFKNSL